VPALLTRGEFVIKREAVKHYGDSLLWALNEKRIPKELLPRFYTGGMVKEGNPQRLITEIGKFENSEFENNLNIDDLIEKLQQLIDSFNGENPPIVKEIKQEIKKLQNEKQKYSALNKDYENFKAENRGKTLNKDEFEKYERTLKIKQEKLNKEKEIIDNLKNEVTRIVEKVKNYLREVEKVKQEIEARLTDLGVEIPAVLKNKIENSFDLDRLRKFNNALKGLNLQNFVEKIKKDFQYRLFILENDIHSKGIAKYIGALDSYNYQVLLDEEKEYIKLKTFLQNPTKLKELALDELKKRLPKFQTGGLLRFEKGGKLAGYGGGDRNLALLEDGEFVIRKEAVRLFGVNLFEKLNNLELPKFQTGGLVDFGKNEVKDLVNINFNMPSGKSYTMQTSEEIAKALASEFKRLM